MRRQALSRLRLSSLTFSDQTIKHGYHVLFCYGVVLCCRERNYSTALIVCLIAVLIAGFIDPSRHHCVIEAVLQLKSIFCVYLLVNLVFWCCLTV